VSAVGNALKALKKAILLEERISSQNKKLEELAGIVVGRGSKAAWRVFSPRRRRFAAQRGVPQN
jgi:hypothetical protein